ncbi:hypothetical protein ACERNI_10660 [Camelimonas sp. ID_303_24]
MVSRNLMAVVILFGFLGVLALSMAGSDAGADAAGAPQAGSEACTSANDAAMCEATRQQIADWHAKAMKGDYQAQRNVSFCMSTTCDKAVRFDPDGGCAWRQVITLSRHASMDSSDASNQRLYCGHRYVTSSAQANAIAKQIMGEISRGER